jgi:hypothetical protein
LFTLRVAWSGRGLGLSAATDGPRSIAGLVEKGVGGLLCADAGGGGLQDADGVVDGRCRIGGLWPMREVAVGGFGGFGGEVDVVGVAAAGHADVEMFAVQPGAGEQDSNVGGGALGSVDGGCPAVVGMPGQVAGG